MPPKPPDVHRILPAAVLAFALLGLFAAGGWRMAGLVQMAPGTPVPAQALAPDTPQVHTDDPTPTDPIKPPAYTTGPGWETLTTRQKEALYPLAERWAFMSEGQKRHWLTLAGNFHALSPAEQAKMVARITDWASLSTQQRSQARLNYAAATRLAPPDTKRAQWEAYQALSAEEKSQLAARAAPKPAGAATALHPVSPKKLARVPAAAVVNTSRPNAPKIPPLSELHTNQAMPVVVPPPDTAVVETTPVAPASAVAVPLAPMAPSEPAPEPAPRQYTPPIHPPE